MYIGLCAGFAASTWIAQVPTLSNWFVKKRGLALGHLQHLPGRGLLFEYRHALPHRGPGLANELSGACGHDVLLIVLPVCIIFHRDHPSDKGTIADAPFVQEPAG